MADRVSQQEVNATAWAACDTFRGVPRYVDTFEEEEEIDIAAVQQDIERLEGELVEVRAKMKQYLEELGV